MLTASATLKDALNNGYTLKCQPRLIAEWNQNRYASLLEVDNTPAETTVNSELDIWPIASIATSQRPKAGIVKGRAVLDPNTATNKTTSDYTDRPPAVRYYTVGPNSIYKYWSSVAMSSTNAPYDITPQYPRVVYGANTWTNKIVVGLENTYSSPDSWTIDITLDGTTWTPVITNPAVPVGGQVIIYRQANGTWGTTVYRDNPMQIRGVRLTVTSMDKANAHLDIIELSPRLETDLSGYLINFSSNYTMSETNFLTPIGRASSNEASISLSNTDGIFNNENSSSIYYGIIDDNVKMTLDLGYDLNDFGSNTVEYIRAFTMYADGWDGQGAAEVTVSVKDSSKFLQEQKAPSLFFQRLTVGESVWRLCDSIGFNNYTYTPNDIAPSTALDYFWCNKEETVWEVMSKLAEGTQTAIYFDKYDNLQIQTREVAFNTTRSIDWALQSKNELSKLADIIEIEQTYDFEANKVNVGFKETYLSISEYGYPALETVWEPEGTFLLRSSALAANMTNASTTIKVTPIDAVLWPYEGTVQVEGELIKYSGKNYAYTEKNTNVIKKIVLKSSDEKDNVDKNLSNPNVAYKNYFTGEFTVTTRGYLWTSAMAHSTDLITSYYARKAKGTTVTNTNSFYTHNINESIVRLATNSTFDANTYYVMSHGETVNPAFAYYGTKIRQPKSGNGAGSGGLAFNLTSLDAGYYVELTRSSVLDANASALNKLYRELAFYIKQADGTMKRYTVGTTHKITENVWYDLDVIFQVVGATHVVTIYLNGIKAQTVTITGADRITPGGRFGMFSRGFNISEFEYVYATMNGNYQSTVDDISFYDRIRQSFTAAQWDRDYVYGYEFYNGGRKPTGTVSDYKKNLYKQYNFDDFGPYVHEVREMDVTFSKYPVVNSTLYMTNDSQIYCPGYNSDAFGAKFMLTNASRNNAVGSGSDEHTEPGKILEQHLMVIARTVTQKDEGTYIAPDKPIYTVQNDAQIRRSGIVEIDIDNPWIQSREAAKSLGEWITAHWAGGADQINVTMFGNPLISIGDLVTVNYPDKNMLPTTHKYFVVGISNSWSTGVATELTLRRARI